MTTLAPYAWLRKIHKEQLDLYEPHLFGSTPDWDINTFITKFTEAIPLEGLSLASTPFELKERATAGFEKAERCFFRIASLEGAGELLMSTNELHQLLTQFADKDLHTHILDPEFKTAF